MNNQSFDSASFTKSERFVYERKAYWEALQNILNKINEKGFKILTADEVKEFPNLYRKICTDSELSKTLELSPDTQEYINRLLQYSHNILYSSPKRGGSQFIRFFLSDFPKAFINNWKPVLFIALLFFGIGLLSFFIMLYNPQLAENVLNKQLIEMMKNSYQSDISEERDINANIYMAGYYIRNNVSIAFFSFVLGVTFCIGTIYVIIDNAITIGSVAGVVVASGYGDHFFNFVLAHSAFELLGICLAAGAGMALGLSIIISKEEKRSVVFSKKAREIVPIIITSALFITIAAFIEGFISPTHIPIYIKAVIAVGSLLFIVFYSYKVILIRFVKEITIRKRRKKNAY